MTALKLFLSSCFMLFLLGLATGPDVQAQVAVLQNASFCGASVSPAGIVRSDGVTLGVNVLPVGQQITMPLPPGTFVVALIVNTSFIAPPPPPCFNLPTICPNQVCSGIVPNAWIII